MAWITTSHPSHETENGIKMFKKPLRKCFNPASVLPCRARTSPEESRGARTCFSSSALRTGPAPSLYHSGITRAAIWDFHTGPAPPSHPPRAPQIPPGVPSNLCWSGVFWGFLFVEWLVVFFVKNLCPSVCASVCLAPPRAGSGLESAELVMQQLINDTLANYNILYLIYSI